MQTLESDLVAALERYKMEVRVANMRRNHLSSEGEMRIGVIDACIGRVLDTLKEREEARAAKRETPLGPAPHREPLPPSPFPGQRKRERGEL